MKIRVSKHELYEAIENVVTKIVREKKDESLAALINEALNEWYEDPDDEMNDIVNRFTSNPKNRIPKDKNAAKARRAAQADISQEKKAAEKDDETVKSHEDAEMRKDTD